MHGSRTLRVSVVSLAAVLIVAGSASAQQSVVQPASNADLSLRFTQDGSGGGGSNGYQQISDFFNVREANANVHQGEWELELEAAWSTNAGSGDDNFFFSPNIKYGYTDDMFIELEVLPLNIGDGGEQGNGDISLQLFHQCVHEDGNMPAFAAWLEARFPTGEGSSGVDGELHLNLTKTLATNFRGHLEGMVETANGSRSGNDDNRRDFQWSMGAGLDYQFNDQLIGVINYVNSSSEEDGNTNQQIVQIGLVHELAAGQHLKLAFDVGVDGRRETPDFGAKIQWSIEW